MKKRTKMWLWILLASPVVLVLLLNIVGRFMPESYSAEGRMAMSISATELWARLHDPETYPMSGRMCKKLELLPAENGRAVWIEHMSGTTLRIRNDASTEPTRLVRILEDTVVPYTGHAEFEIESAGDGCVVTCRNTSTIRSGTWHVPFFRVMIGVFGGAKSGCKDYLTRLSGGTGTIEWID